MKQDNKQLKYFVYIRKSSDRKDAQALSLPAQKRVLDEFIEKEKIDVVETFVESASAHKTGRPIFNQMLDRIEKGEAEGILVYHLTRIARNSYDGGRVIYMMDEGLLQEIRTPEGTYCSTKSDDKFIMQIHFAMSKKSSDDISQFVKRDIDSKIQKGEYPVSAPIGYLNLEKEKKAITGKRFDIEKQRMLEEISKKTGERLRRIEPDPFLAPIIAELYAACATDTYSLNELRIRAFKLGLTGVRSNKIPSKSTVFRILTNPFYYGALPWKGTIHEPETMPVENRHKGIVDKKMFMQVQEVLAKKVKPRKYVHNHKYTGIIRCGECGGMITAEVHKGTTYYRCTKKKEDKGSKHCSQSYIKEDDLEKQIRKEINRYVMPNEFMEWSLKTLNSSNDQESERIKNILDQQRRQLSSIEQQLGQLLKMKISANNLDESMLSDEEYIAQKNELAEEKKIIKERITDTEQSADNWLEQCESFFDFAVECGKEWEEGDAKARKYIFASLFGSNAILDNKELLVTAEKPFFEAVCFEDSFQWRGRWGSNP